MSLSRIVSLILLSVLGVVATVSAQPETSDLNWYKGNTHTHTLNSDGDSTPYEVARWYREHGYQFLVLTDHNFLTSVTALNALLGARDQFLLIEGDEVSDEFGGKPLHLNGLDLKSLVLPQGGDSVAEVLQNNVDAIRAASGVPHINHPNFGWALTAADLAAVENYKLLEIFNGHPRVNNLSGGGRPSVEGIWDQLLTTGKVVFGIAVDDAHVFKRPWDPRASKPGQGWVVVRARELSPRAIMSALEQGEFYASTGVEIEDYSVTDTSYEVTVKEYRDTKYRIQFIGTGGQLLLEVPDSKGTYQFKETDEYVRAKVLSSNGKTAWLQPAFAQ